MAPDTNTPAPQELAEHPPLLLTDDQADALVMHLSGVYPGRRIWRAGGIWHATGPCPLLGCLCTRTLHAPDPVDLCRQLDEVKQPSGAQREART